MSKNTNTTYAQVPMQWAGPVKLTGPVVREEVSVPLATFESPLWPSVNRGAKVSLKGDGIRAVVARDAMTRSLLFEAENAETAVHGAATLKDRFSEIAEVVASGSRFARLIELHTEISANLLYIRLAVQTGDAAGHNMVTKAADQVAGWIREQMPAVRFLSVSGNFCTDKKVSSVNGILGRGKHVIAEMTVPRKVCEELLRATPEQIAELNLKKNLMGTILAGGVRTANAHFANMLLAVYLATGQDAASIVEGSQGMVHAEVRGDALYFAVTLPNLIVGTVGSGKGLAFVQENLEKLGCLADREPGENSQRLAVITAATVWCGELSLLAALTNPGELMRVHLNMERPANP